MADSGGIVHTIATSGAGGHVFEMDGGLIVPPAKCLDHERDKINPCSGAIVPMGADFRLLQLPLSVLSTEKKKVSHGPRLHLAWSAINSLVFCPNKTAFNRQLFETYLHVQSILRYVLDYLSERILLGIGS